MRVETAGGQVIDLGTTEAAPTIGIIDYSRRVTDDFGVTTVVERSFSRRMTVRLTVPFEQADAVQQQLASLRATAALWVADDRYASLAIEGFYKDFSLDLNAPPISYCTLTVEGLAESAPPADAGGDPAPVGSASTLRLLQPATIASANLIASNVPEADYPEWAAATVYALGARVIKAAAHKVYESVVAGNTGKDPAASPEWLEVGATNRWAMFDQALGSATAKAGSIAVTLDVGAVSAVALLDVTGATVRVQAPGYDQTQAVAGGPVTFLNLSGAAGQVTVTVAGPGQVAVGTLLIGKLVALGITEAAPTAEITDFSRKETDDFGEIALVERAWAKRMTAKALIRSDAVDAVAGRIAAVRARPSLWIGETGMDSLTVFGFFKDFSIEVGEAVSKLSLSIEGLSKAAPILEEASLRTRGPYSAGEEYRRGDIVHSQGSAWEYVSAAATAGNAPPTLPVTQNLYWRLFARAGEPGAPAKTLIVDASRGALYMNNQGAWSPAAQDILFTALKQNTTAPVTWTVTDLAGNAITPSAVLSSTTGDFTAMTTAQFAAVCNAFGAPGAIVTATLSDGGTFSYSRSVLRVAQGEAGGAGLSVAEIGIFKRSASGAPATPSGGTYDFASKTLTAVPTGWFVTAPVGDDPLYQAKGVASVQGISGTATPAWAGVGFIAEKGAVGAAGAGVDIVFRRSAAQPGTPAASAGTPADWYSDVASVPAGADPLWSSFGQRASGASTYAWDVPVRVQGIDGAAGLNNAHVLIYKRSASAPALPTATATYTFSSGALGGLNNGWVQVPPAGSDPLYLSVATASSSAASDTIAAGEWASPVVMVQNGAAGISAATVPLYQRTTTSAAPALPSAASTYTFATGVLSGHNNGWAQTMPAASAGPYLWVTQATALGTAATDTIAASEWAAASLMARSSDGMRLAASAEGFTFTDGASDGVVTSITFTATSSDAAEAVTFTTSPAVTLTGTGNSRTLSLANFGANRQVVVTATGATTGNVDVAGASRLDRSTAAAGATKGRNLVPNPDAESGGVEGWKVDMALVAAGGATFTGTFTADTIAPLGGKYKFLLSKPTTSQWAPAVSAAMPVVPGRKYLTRLLLQGVSATASGLVIAAWERGSAPSGGFVDFPNRSSFTTLADNVAVATAVTELSWTYTAPAGVTFVSLLVASLTNGPSLSFDAVEFYELTDHELSADVTYTIVGASAAEVVAKADGTFAAGVLAAAAQSYSVVTRAGDVTANLTYAATTKEGTGTASIAISNGKAVLTPLTLPATSVFEISASLGGDVRDKHTLVLKKITPPGETGSTGSGLGTSTSGTIDGLSASTTPVALTSIKTVKAGAGGNVVCNAPIEYVRQDVSNGVAYLAAVWRWRVIGGTFADITTAVLDSAGSTTASGDPPTPSFLTCNMTKSGLTNGTDYEVQLFGYRSGGTGTVSIYGQGGSSATVGGT